MRKLLLIILLLIVALPCTAQTFVQGNQGTAASDITVTVTLNGTTAGNALWMFLGWYRGSAAVITTPAGWTVATAQVNLTFPTVGAATFYRTNIAGGNVSQGVDWNAVNGGVTWQIAEISSVAASGTLDVSTSTTGTTGSTFTSSTWTTTSANEIVLYGAVDNLAATWAAGNIAGSAATLRTSNNDANAVGAAESRNLTSTVTNQTASISAGSSADGWITIVNSFVGSAAAPGINKRNKVEAMDDPPMSTYVKPKMDDLTKENKVVTLCAKCK